MSKPAADRNDPAKSMACCAPDQERRLSAGVGPAAEHRIADPPPASREAHPWGRSDRDLIGSLAESASGELRMIGVAGGEFRMGSTGPETYPEDGEGPVRTVRVAPFAMAATTVTVADFAVFAAETGHRSDAEAYGTSLVFAGLLDSRLRKAAPAVAATPWWREVAGATWFRPEGPGSSAAGREGHPVAHVSQRDASAYALWSGTRLPTETEWEYAARGGLDQQPYPWGAVREPGGRVLMNTFAGEFPDSPAGPVGTVAAADFPPNAYGLHNMTGNVWEWTSSSFRDAGDARPVLRGGSYMCHASYCRRYRTSARTPATAETSLGHTGFRLALTTG